jgi:hypothetical protein
MVRPCSCPASKRSWQGGAKDKEHAMSQTANTAIAVIGIDIGKNSLMQDRRRQFDEIFLQRTAGPYIWVNRVVLTACR